MFALLGTFAAVAATYLLYQRSPGAASSVSRVIAPNPASSGVIVAQSAGGGVLPAGYLVNGNDQAPNPNAIMANPYDTNPGGGQPNAFYQTYNAVPGQNVSLVPYVPPPAGVAGATGDSGGGGGTSGPSAAPCSCGGSGYGSDNAWGQGGNCGDITNQFSGGGLSSGGGSQLASTTGRLLRMQGGDWLDAANANSLQYLQASGQETVPSVASATSGRLN